MKNSKGITLIALVITIIVLLILAGVSIAMLTGGNGLLTKAAEARVDNYLGEVCDRINTALNACYAEILSNQYGVGSDILSGSNGEEEILKSNGMNVINLDDKLGKIGTYNATVTKPSESPEADQPVVEIKWTPVDEDYGTEAITGTITKVKDGGKVPYKVEAAVVPAKAE